MDAKYSRRFFCAWSLLALPQCHAVAADQEPGKPLLIALLSTGHNDSSIYAALKTSLAAGMQDRAARMQLIIREGGFSAERLGKMADEIFLLRPNILICLDLTAAIAASAHRHDSNLSMVFLAHDDPLASGLIQSFAKPGNNITGVTTFRCVDGKMIEILTYAFPKRKRIGYLLDRSNGDDGCMHLAKVAAERAGVQLIDIEISEQGFASRLNTTIPPLHLDAVIAPASAPLWQNRAEFVKALNALQLPVIYESELFLHEGGLMYYGPVRTNTMAQVAAAVRKILAGESAGDIPVEQPTLFELVINLSAPHAAEFGISPSALRRADRILQ
jgi:putative tryptophan/tyrosine transport system substrate-binding protein